MKILSWNIERPVINDKRKNKIIETIESFDADLIFLTETNDDITFEGYHCIKTIEQYPKYQNMPYGAGENKATIYSRYNFTEIIETYDNFSSVCARIKTAHGDMVLYGSIIGFLGGKDEYFKNDLEQQKKDLARISKNDILCFSGDLNISFSGFPYPSKQVADEMKFFFTENNLSITTEANDDCAIHIVLSDSLLKKQTIETKMISIKSELSDHNMVITEIR